MEEDFKKFSNRVYITECARFEGYRRMKRRKLSSTVSLAILSLSIIVFNILQLCDGYEAFNQSITAVTIMLSVLVLVLSLLVSYLNYSEKEMKYYNCAIKLSALCDEIDLVLSDDKKTFATNQYLRVLKDRYQRIIGECGINHISIDHKRAELRIDKKNAKRRETNNDNTSKDEKGKPNSYPSWKKRASVWIEWNIFDVNSLYWILAILIPITAALIIFKSDVFRRVQESSDMFFIIFH